MSMFKVHVSPNDSFLSLIDVLTHRKLRYRSNDIHSAKQTSPLWQSLPSWHCTLPSQTLASHCHRSAWLFLQCLHLPYFPERPRYRRKFNSVWRQLKLCSHVWVMRLKTKPKMVWKLFRELGTQCYAFVFGGKLLHKLVRCPRVNFIHLFNDVYVPCNLQTCHKSTS